MTHANLRHIRLAGLAATANDDDVRRARSMLVLRQRVSGIAEDATRAAARLDTRTRRSSRTTKAEAKAAFKAGRWPSSISLNDLEL